MTQEIGKKEKTINYIFSQLTEIYYLKSICLEILKDLESKDKLSQKEKYWQDELYKNIFYIVDI